MRAKKVPRHVTADDGWLELAPDVPVEAAASSSQGPNNEAEAAMRDNADKRRISDNAESSGKESKTPKLSSICVGRSVEDKRGEVENGDEYTTDLKKMAAEYESQMAKGRVVVHV